MAIIQVIPHSPVGVVTSVAFVPFGIALEAVPNMFMAIAVTDPRVKSVGRLRTPCGPMNGTSN
jgi:hypothetical protein